MPGPGGDVKEAEGEANGKAEGEAGGSSARGFPAESTDLPKAAASRASAAERETGFRRGAISTATSNARSTEV